MQSITAYVTVNGYYLLCGTEYARHTIGLLSEFHSKEEKRTRNAADKVALV
jgi:hypothetical protein